MADSSIQSDIFKFVSLRPPNLLDPNNKIINQFSDTRNEDNTPVAKAISDLDSGEQEEVVKSIQKLVKEKKYSPDDIFDPAVSDLDSVYEYVKNSDRKQDAVSLKKSITDILGKTILGWIKDNSFKSLTAELWDRLYAFYILQRVDPQNLETLHARLRAGNMLSYISVGQNLINADTINALLKATPVIPTIFSFFPKTVVAPEPEENKSTKGKTKQYKQIWNDLIDQYNTLEKVKQVNLEASVETEVKKESAKEKKARNIANANTIILKSRVFANKAAFGELPAESKKILKTLNITQNNFDLSKAVSSVQQNLTMSYTTVSTISDPLFWELIPGGASAIPGITSIIPPLVRNWGTSYPSPGVPIPPPPPAGPLNARNLIKPLGIGDLKVVKQKLLKYTTGEIAHIENVLRGESKERKYRTLDRTENIVTTTLELSEETTRDTQTTDRFELKKESENTIQEQLSIQAGVNVTASYGPVSVGAHADFAYSTSSQDTNKTSSNFAKEIVDKSVTSIQKKTSEARTTKQLHEVEELDTHGINNEKGTDNISGIYRWVDKHYEAQIYNYGKRMMFEFIIPEPAAFYLYGQNNNPAKTPDADKPDPINFTHRDLNESNFHIYIKKYNVQGVTPPPPWLTRTSMAFDQAAIENGKTLSKSFVTLTVPLGYENLLISFGTALLYKNDPVFELVIGDETFNLLTNQNSEKFYAYGPSLVKSYTGFIPVSVSGYDINAYSINVVAIHIRKPEFFEDWQIKVYEKIMSAYQAMKEIYDEKVSRVQSNKGIVIEGKNPLINRSIEKKELKKHALKMFMEFSLYGNFQAMKDGSGPNGPEFDVIQAISEGKNIQFFEQAFEWENITYLFYPYFWGRKAGWIQNSNTYDTDPLFTQFLQAGAARIVVPVYPAYNDAVLHYLESGELWPGGEAPRIDDPLYISISQELKDQTDDLANAVPEGEPWDVVLPTTLVYLQADSKLPDYTTP